MVRPLPRRHTEIEDERAPRENVSALGTQRYRDEVYSPATKLPESDLVFFLLDTVSKLDLRRFDAPYEDETRGALPFDPAMMVCLLLDAYCVGAFSSRKIALACERNLAFLAIVGIERLDFRTISDFRKLHLDAFADVFVQGAADRRRGRDGEAGQSGDRWDENPGQCVAVRGHELWRYAQGSRRLREAIETLATQAHQQDTADDAALGSRRGEELPVELARQEKRLATIEAAMQRLEARAKADAEAERQRRAEQRPNGDTRAPSAGAKRRKRWTNS